MEWSMKTKQRKKKSYEKREWFGTSNGFDMIAIGNFQWFPLQINIFFLYSILFMSKLLNSNQ